MREEVFQLFSRNRATVSGSGLGLTIARDIMRAHGGEITLLDSPRGGLRVLVRLPTPD
ncbi:ATP-binding protein [Sorlinia euscelidii]|uniref:ATP-binding protein n=1 Tax=Sorlinia euscelidii TaxID=3081148 RepID=UPI00374E0161